MIRFAHFVGIVLCLGRAGTPIVRL